jgi:hypothetical protein
VTGSTYAVAHLLEELDFLGLERSHRNGLDMVLKLAAEKSEPVVGQEGRPAKSDREGKRGAAQ